ncbi:MAG: hypothetical protein Q7S95_04395 [bacterium]|nr:hypothetical protein [bacterium]
MYAYTTVENRHAKMAIRTGLGHGQHVRLAGSTFPIVPNSTFVEGLSFDVPDGQHAIAFFSKVEGPREVGSGKTRRLDYAPVFGSCIVLCWSEDDKAIVKSSTDMSAAELSKFNGFTASATDIYVTSADHMTVYCCNPASFSTRDLKWNYKQVSVDAMLGYVTKRLTLEGLDAAAEGEQKARDELADLRGLNYRLGLDLLKAEAREKNQRLRADGLVETLDRFANWVERMQQGQRAKVFSGKKAPNTTAAVTQVLRDRHLNAEGFSALSITLAGLINGQADPVD